MALDYAASYRKFVKSVLARERPAGVPGREQAMAEAVGGRFDEFGQLMVRILIQAGLMPGHYLIDVGCGSGRLTRSIASYLTGPYLGTDVVPALLNNARKYGKPDWRFQRVSEVTIPEDDNCADMVCFFSVLTHLLHEDSYRYLREAKRVLKSRGRIVFSFLEFRVFPSRDVFRHMVKRKDDGVKGLLDQFVSREAIDVWADELGLEVLRIVGGDESQIAEDGSGICSLGQSLCILEKNEKLEPRLLRPTMG